MLKNLPPASKRLVKCQGTRGRFCFFVDAQIRGDLLCSAAPVAIGIGWYMLGDTMKKYPDDTLPSLAIQFVCFTVLFATWILGDIGWKHGAPGIVDWLGQVPAILQTPGAKSEFRGLGAH